MASLRPATLAKTLCYRGLVRRLFHNAMEPRSSARVPLRALAPRARVEAVADAGSVEWLDAPRPSAALARFGIVPQDDDGVVTARVRLRGEPWLVAAQDERFLGGSIGAGHGEALRAMFECARVEGVRGVLLLAASGGVRLHEANAAELAAARALRALLDARAAGVAVDAVAVGDVFGGASVLAAAADRFAAVPGVRIGVSGPKVIETARGRDELDAGDAEVVEAIFGAAARVRDGAVDAVADDAAVIATWVLSSRRTSLDDALRGGERPGPAPAPPPLSADWRATPIGGGLWRGEHAFIVAPFAPLPVGVAALTALDAALLAHVGVDEGPDTLIILEDSPGHDVSRAAEQAFLSGALAHHAAVLTHLRTRGVRIVGALVGVGHSAAFFANALQADALCAVNDARVIAMAPDAIARVTGVAARTLVEDDPLLGQPVRHFAALGGIDAVLPDPDPAGILAAARRFAARS